MPVSASPAPHCMYTCPALRERCSPPTLPPYPYVCMYLLHFHHPSISLAGRQPREVPQGTPQTPKSEEWNPNKSVGAAPRCNTYDGGRSATQTFRREASHDATNVGESWRCVAQGSTTHPTSIPPVTHIRSSCLSHPIHPYGSTGFLALEDRRVGRPL